MRVLLVMVLTVFVGGCSRAFYRRWADRDTYKAIEERNADPRWSVPQLSITPPPQSRLYDPYNPDHPPLPPDDPAAYRYMEVANGMRGYRHWHKDGDAPFIEDPAWRESLALAKDDTLVLTPERAVELGLLNSREYQTQLEQLYLAALALTFNRFDFACHWFLTNDTLWTHFGSSADEMNTLSTLSSFGFSKSFSAGGQLMVDLLNTFVFQFAGSPDHTTTTSNILVTFMQPLLRNFGRNIRMEGLTEAERNLLYQLRTFAHFRKSFAVNIATNSYLNQLSQQQRIVNQQANLASLQTSLRLHDALLNIGQIAKVKRDEVFQSIQAGELALIQAQATLETLQDNYKLILGLPPNLPIRLDDSVLAPFQLSSPAVNKLKTDTDNLLADYRKLDQPPPTVKLEDGFRRLRALYGQASRLVEDVSRDLESWKEKLAAPQPDQERLAGERAAHQQLAKDLEELRHDLKNLDKEIAASAAAIPKNKPAENWQALQERTGRVSVVAADLFDIQTRVRAYLIKLRPVKYQLAEATEYALANRLDLMNQRAQVVDAWRQIGVTANALETELDVVFAANLATPGSGNPVDFRASASTYSVGFHFDGPLNRYAARNAYRASLINYEQARRAYMALEDEIERRIRLDLRNLNTAKLSFEISRQSLLTAVTQIEGAREDLLFAKSIDPTSTLNILRAEDAVLAATNGLIDNWVTYETGRIQLLLDMEALQLNERGLYSDESDNRTGQSSADGS